MTTSPDSPTTRSFLLPAILTGGLLAGVFDATSAFMTFGWRMPYGIASGLLGSNALTAAKGGSTGVWLLGLLCHFTIALGAAAIYCLASRWLGFLKKHFLFGAVCCGVGVTLTMNLVVLPLSAVPFPVGPFKVEQLRSTIVALTLLVGVPIATSLWFFARRAERAVAQP